MDFGVVGLLLLLAIFLISHQGFKDPIYFERYTFCVRDILYGREYQRLVTSGFLHTSWTHLLLNAATFYCFSGSIEDFVGIQNYLSIYFLSLLGGNLLSLFLHRHESNYTAVGASGAITGLVFATVALYPGVEIGIIGLPYHVPGWLYGLLYVAISTYGISARRDNIGHDAHLGGGLAGLLTVVTLYPELLRTNYLAIGAIVLPAVAFLYFLLRRPNNVQKGRLIFMSPTYQTVDDRYKSDQRRREIELDELLEKVSSKGIDGLSSREKQELERLSR